MEKKRVYQVAKDFHISSEALVSMLKEHHNDVKSHMSIVSDEMLESVKRQFEKQHDAAVKDIEKKTKIVDVRDKKTPEETAEKPTPSKRRKKKRRQQKTETADQKQPPTDKVVRKDHPRPGQPVLSDDKKNRVKSRKRKKKVDMAAVQDTFKKTLASISADEKKNQKASS